MIKITSAAVLALTASSLSGALIGRWEPNLGGQASSYGPIPSNWDGVGGGADNYTGTPGDDQFRYIIGTGPAASNRDGRWEDPVPGFPAIPPEQHYTVQPRVPGAFVTDPSGSPNRTQINLGIVPQLNSITNNFYAESTFTATQLGGDNGSAYSVLLGWDHSAGGSSSSRPAIGEGFKFGIGTNSVWFTSFGIVDQSWSVVPALGGPLQIGVTYNLRVELTENGIPGQSDYTAFLNGVNLGTSTFLDLNPVVTLDVIDANDGSVNDDLQKNGPHLNSWYIGAGGTGQHFSGTIDHVEIGSIPVIPEPSSLLLTLTVAIGFAHRRRR